jgi:anti-sigma factor RsiW
MECDKSTQIEAYHDGRLDAAARAAVESHVLQCEACWRLLEQLRRLSLLVAHSPMAVMPAETMERLAHSFDLIRSRALGERMIQERAARDRGVLRIAGWLTAAAASLLMGGLVLLSPANKPQNLVEVPPQATPAWEPAAIMPPAAAQEGTPEVVQVAQWIANDLSISNPADLPDVGQH